MSEDREIWCEVQGSVGRIHLNRPRAINALTLPMIHEMAAALARFAADPAVALVLVTGAGERGLCAGGDIRALYERGRDGSGFGADFFRAEYRMNAQIAGYAKPYVAIMDGITMGGGVGISAHGSVRIVTERTRLAMPETGIGFFPDIGGTWLLARAPGELGTYLGLSGESIGGADAIAAGLADDLVPSSALPALVDALCALPPTALRADVRAVVARFAQPAASPLAAHQGEIDTAFGGDDVAAILAALAASGTDFARAAQDSLARKSPTSLKLTLRLLRAARHSASLRDCLEREFIAAHQVLASDEFHEGVRAAVIDKDRNPHWNPASLDAVTEAVLAPYFTPRADTLF